MVHVSVSDIPLISWYILVLVFLEGLLSADNALVLALMVRHLPKPEQRRVLRYGIWGAVGFRVVAVLLSAVLMRFWIFKILGGLYLFYLAIKHFIHGEPGPDEGRSGWERTFWGTVTAVTLTDIAFSIDSILTAVAMADDFPARFGDFGKMSIVFAGGVLGIITMRFVVRYFIIALDHFPGLAQGAYFLVAWIGLKLVLSGLEAAEFTDYAIPEWLFWSVMLGIIVVSLLARPRRKPSEVGSSLELFDEEEKMLAEESLNGEAGTAPIDAGKPAEGSSNGVAGDGPVDRGKAQTDSARESTEGTSS
ncbi:MAG: TerC family protein [Isosphaeraceae bacterium]